ncbi:MAG: DUF3109 family protein [Bacteroidetes bacterium]|nr:DUF3109 family protein [Bacteroidota bacterium]
MIEIDGTFVEKDILTKYFLCDIEQCLGACCTFYGIYGAPLDENEITILENHIEITKHLLSDTTIKYIEENGVANCKLNKYYTVCINNKDCVFVYYKGNKVALCSIENCFFRNKTDFRKPISCWLFPIRVASFNNTFYIYYEKIKECSSAVKNGKQKNVKLYQALKEPLIAFFGEKWYKTLENKAKEF